MGIALVLDQRELAHTLTQFRMRLRNR
jgi:hypothetical protein